MRVWLGAVLLVVTLATSAAAQEGPSRWQVDRGPDGEVEARRDAHGNSSTYRRSDEGRKTTVTHDRNGAGSWQEVWIEDQGGSRVVEVVRPRASGLVDYLRVLRIFGLAPGKPLPESTRGWHLIDGHGRFIAESPFGRFEHVVLVRDDGIGRRETTTVLDRSLTIETVRSEDGLVARDTAGGWRMESYDDGRLLSARDEHGVIVRVERDELDRAVAYWLGELGVLRFSYEDSSPQWTVKELVDLRDGKVVFRWETATRPGTIGPDAQSVKSRPGAAIRLFVPGHGTIAEWDPMLYPEGVMVARLGDHPYALVPFDHDLDVVRSLTLFELATARGWDRIDYTRDHLFVHMTTDAADSDTAEQTAIIVLPRRSADDEQRIGESATLPFPQPRTGSDMRRQAAKLEVAPCGSENPDCTCITWDTGVSISCPEEGGDTGGDPPLGGGTGGSGGGGSSGGDGGDGGTDGGSGGTTTTLGNPPTPAQRSQLNRATPIAIERLQNRAGCARLFADLNRTNGQVVIELTTYRDWSNHDACGKGAPAFTTPNRLTVFLCPPFERLSVYDAAATLIHEALHSAGLTEKPNYPDAEMTTTEIQRMVDTACGL
ncbi:MAG TPA: hypothetical protein VHM02_12210 [Thermoanaerobaculia bacterium]|nr:hypothetical protein [Thermoanaerobaculia bacterium]